MDRDFKGVWIPKDIWLNKELSALDRVMFAEISSLDNESHCIASNEYFAEFCGVGVATITRSISKLRDMGLIETSLPDGRHRVIKVIGVPNQNDEAATSKRLAINIDNNTDNKKKSIKEKEETKFDTDTPLGKAMEEWLAYKKERRQAYKERGLAIFIRTCNRYADEYGADAVIECINKSIMNNYQGVFFDNIKKTSKPTPTCNLPKLS